MTNDDHRPNRKTLVLLHGALVRRAMWSPQIEDFAKEFHVVTLDLPAHGNTPDLVGAYSVERLSEFVVEQLDGANIVQAHICGHSLGGMVAQQLAVDHPERVAKLILAESSFGTQNSFSERIQTFFARLFLRVIPANTLADLSAKQYGSLHAHVGRFVREEMNRYDHKTSMRVLEAAFAYAGKERLDQIKSPTLVLVAENNKMTHAQGKEMAALIPDATFGVIKRANHLLNMDNPEDFNRSVLAFLRVGN